MKPPSRCVRIVLPLPIGRPLDYAWPESLPVPPRIGLRVLVPLGNRRLAGYIVGTDANPAPWLEETARPAALKEVLSVLDEEPLFGQKELGFYQWLARYYLAPLGEVLRTALPGSINLRTCKGIRILPEGLMALKHGVFLTPQEEEILRHLQKSGRLPWMRLRQKIGRGASSCLRSLEDKGFVEACQILRGKRGPKEKARVAFRVAIRESATPAEVWISMLPAEHAQILAYLCRHGPCRQEDLEAAIPGSVHHIEDLADRGLVRCETMGSALGGDGFQPEPHMEAPRLTEEQRRAVDTIRPFLDRGESHSFLLHGITGSGKTEVYLHVIALAMKKGKEALVLVPEIGLTPQTLRRFSARFGPGVAVLHSRITEKERLDLWWRIRKGQARIVIGVRSAIFAPFQNLGVIVVDEEHDPSYKQQERLRYNGRDLALVRGQREKAVVILGSATPSLESYYNVQAGRSSLLELTKRIGARPLPEVLRIDMRKVASAGGGRECLSPALREALVENSKEGTKSLLFLNRRGYATTLICRDCGHLFRCPHCSVSLTFHRYRRQLCCHYCEHQTAAPSVCPSCRGTDVQPVGKGTEKVEEEIRALLPTARVARMDRDTTRGKDGHEGILRRFRDGDLDILVGTQMVTKGHDIPAVTLVGVVLADVSLDLPDFRAAERTLQLLMQVAGRAGRGRWPGRVLIQTYHPDHYCIRAVCQHDYKGFYEQEIAYRRDLNYPPFCRMVNIRLTGRDEAETERAAQRMGEIARQIQEQNEGYRRGIEILGPSPAPLARIRSRHRFNCFVKGKAPKTLHSFARELMNQRKAFLSSGKVQLEVDVDPLQIL